MDLRRHLTRRNLLIGLGAGATIATIDGLAIEPYWLEVTRHRVALAELPAALDGFTIAQITDAHLTGIGRVETSILAVIREVSPPDVRVVFRSSRARQSSCCSLTAPRSLTSSRPVASICAWPATPTAGRSVPVVWPR